MSGDEALRRAILHEPDTNPRVGCFVAAGLAALVLATLAVVALVRGCASP